MIVFFSVCRQGRILISEKFVNDNEFLNIILYLYGEWGPLFFVPHRATKKSRPALILEGDSEVSFGGGG